MLHKECIRQLQLKRMLPGHLQQAEDGVLSWKMLDNSVYSCSYLSYRYMCK